MAAAGAGVSEAAALITTSLEVEVEVEGVTGCAEFEMGLGLAEAFGGARLRDSLLDALSVRSKTAGERAIFFTDERRRSEAEARVRELERRGCGCGTCCPASISASTAEY